MPAPRGGERFLWPVQGKVISNFGPKKGGLNNDGINIAAPEGATVIAADNGVVAYAGNELRGFGNLLLIRHADGWVTAYAHNEKLLVKRGEKVKRGQAIAQIGSTGNVPSPQLHFELRKGTDPVDPLKYLGS
jgi:murein DD-endopeptidase MepM/ murein hydrolase activator NlpD